jgi:hypothetical protein
MTWPSAAILLSVQKLAHRQLHLGTASPLRSLHHAAPDCCLWMGNTSTTSPLAADITVPVSKVFHGKTQHRLRATYQR